MAFYHRKLSGSRTVSSPKAEVRDGIKSGKINEGHTLDLAPANMEGRVLSIFKE